MTEPTCSLCGEPMPAGEEMFLYHGFSGGCPKPPLPKMTVDLDIPHDPATRAIYDDAWNAVMANGELALARKKLSIHELRHIIRCAVKAVRK